MPDHAFLKTNRGLQDTKKFGCTAQIKIREIVSFTEFEYDNISDKPIKSYLVIT